MAKYKSKYAELGFYAKGELRRFLIGEYRTDDEAEIAVLDSLADVVRVKEIQSEAIEGVAVEAKVTPRSRKTSAK